MASFYWYERNPELLQAEKSAMQQFFPHFKLQTLDDGRLYWVGTLNPRGKAGGTWTLMAIYQHDHPNNDARYGSSVRIYSIKPDLDELCRAAGSLPHVLVDEANHYYMCTSDRQYVKEGLHGDKKEYEATSAASSLAWAAKWIFIVEEWLEGELPTREVFADVY
ncbi:hypothetical protein [Collinsella intestinalis]|uniref:hypothetical protein n=1 Tax=Collinsella intestinalis TaxID=147207 RepID=UPI00195E1423|nr:hypothetical protein [Collinsella intestinalis]MBM6942563.1 hypothetical protein [Collinsella intestinalis]